MNYHRTLSLAGAVAWAFCALGATAAVEKPVYDTGFETETLADLEHTQWSFDEVAAGSPVLLSTPPGAGLATRFLAEFGRTDAVSLSLDLPPGTTSVRLRFDAYLLRTWDGQDTPYGGPDVFGYGISGRLPEVENSFSNGAGVQSYCPFAPPGTETCEQTWGSDGTLKNQLGFAVELEPDEGSIGPEKGTPMSLVYRFDSVIDYTGTDVVFRFFSSGLQFHEELPNRVIDESWGLDNFVVTATVVPEPHASALLLAGLLFLAAAAHRRRRLPSPPR